MPSSASCLPAKIKRSPSGVRGVLRPKDVGAGGWCFFNAFFDQLGTHVIPAPTFLAVLALEALADRQTEFAPFVGDGEGALELSEARAALREVRVFRDLCVVEGLTPFQCVVLDKFEGVITGDLYASRRYADDSDMQVLLGPSGLVLESNDIVATGPGCRSRLYPSLERTSAGRAADLLEAGALDMVFVR